MQAWVEKFARTAQSATPLMKPIKDSVYLHARRWLKIPHESQFRVIGRFPSLARSFVDVGANQGQSIESALLFNSDAKITAFEANPKLAEMLLIRYAANSNIKVVGNGLGREAKWSVMYVPKYNGFVYDGAGSLRIEDADWLSPARMIRFDPARYNIDKIDCRIETLDSFELAPTFLKIDVQGTEYDVLAGGKETIARHEPLILMEAPDAACSALLEQLGYVEHGFIDGDLIEGRVDNRHANTFYVTRHRIEALRRDNS